MGISSPTLFRYVIWVASMHWSLLLQILLVGRKYLLVVQIGNVEVFIFARADVKTLFTKGNWTSSFLPCQSLTHMIQVLCGLQLLGLGLCSAHHINWLPFITTTTSSHLPDLAGRRRITVTTTVHQSSQYLMMTLFHIKLTGVLNLSFIAE